MTLSLTAQTTSEAGTVKVVNLKGSARYFLTGDPTPHPIKVGDVLKPGAIVQTAAASYVDVVLNNAKALSSGIGGGPSSISTTPTAVMYARPSMEQDAIRILENTVLGIEKLNITHTGADRVTETELDLKAGKIFGTVKKLSAGSKYNIKIPNGVAAIRGTVYFVSSTGEVSILTSASQLQAAAAPGSMILAYIAPDGTAVTQIVGPGQHFDTTSGQLSPIPDAQYRQMIDWVNQLAVQPGGRVIVFPVDVTMYYLSGLFPEQQVDSGGQGQGGQSPGGQRQLFGMIRQGQAPPLINR